MDETISVQKSTREAILLYGAFAMVLGGGAGVWVPLLIPDKHVAVDALATYVFAILAPLLADAVLHEPYWKRLSKAIRMRLVVGVGIAGALALVALLREGKSGDWTSAVFAMVTSLIVWYFISHYSGRFEPESSTPPVGAQGGTVVSPDELSGGGL